MLTNGLDEGVLLAAIAYLGADAGGAGRSRRAMVAERSPKSCALPAFETYVTTAKALARASSQVPPGPDYAFPVDGVLRGDHAATRG